MSQVPTAKLNTLGRVTLHPCVRLELHQLHRCDGTGPGSRPGIYPIYRCSETASERIFGCLRRELNERELARFFPSVGLYDGDELAQGDDQVESIVIGASSIRRLH